MKKLFLLSLLFLTSSIFAQTPTDGDFRTASTGALNWTGVTTWQIRTSGLWVNTVTSPTSTSNVYIQAGSIVTVDVATADCNDLNIEDATGVLAIGSNILRSGGKIRAYTGTAEFTPGPDGTFYSDQTSNPNPSASCLTSTPHSGMLSFTGSSRNITLANEWGETTSGVDIQINLNSGETATSGVNMKAANWFLTSGILDCSTNSNTIYADNGTTGGHLTVSSGFEWITEGKPILARTGSSSADSLTLNIGAVLRITGDLPTIAAEYITLAGTVEYARTGAQTLVDLTAGGTDIYSNLTIIGTGIKTLSSFIEVKETLTLSGGTLDLNGKDLILDSLLSKTSGNIDASAEFSAIVFSNSTPLTLPPSLFTGNVYYFDLVNQGGVTLSDPLNIIAMLSTASGILTLGPNDVTILAGGFLKIGSSQSYIRTNGTGSFIAQALDTGFAQTFSVGNSTYNPVQIDYHGTIRDWKVNVKDTISSGTIGLNPHAKVNRQWNITPSSVIGVSADLTFQWNDADEDTDFRHDTSAAMYVAHFDESSPGNGWFPYSSSKAEDGSEQDSYITTVKGMTLFSPYAVANDGALPVELASFTSSLSGRDAKLSWTTNSEINNSGFDVERKDHGSNTWKKLGNVQGAGTTSIAKNYTYTDKKLETGKFDYRLKQIDLNGNYKYYDLSTFVDVTTPTVFSLSQNYPNPFNPATKIDYDLPADSKVEIMLYDMTGRQVASLVNASQTVGYHTISFNASSMASGMYFYRIVASSVGQSFVKTMKMMLVK